MWVVKRAALLCNAFCNNVPKQVAWFLLPVLPYLKLVQRWPVSWIRSIQVAPHYLDGFKRTFQPKVVDALLVGNGKYVIHCNQFPPIFDPPYMYTKVLFLTILVPFLFVLQGISSKLEEWPRAIENLQTESVMSHACWELCLYSYSDESLEKASWCRGL